MGTLLFLLVVFFIVGLLVRDKGDGFLDTLGNGCSTSAGCIISVIVAVVILAILAAIFGA